MLKACSGPLFPSRPHDLASVRFPALTRVGEGGPIIPTVYEYGKPCGPYRTVDWCVDDRIDMSMNIGMSAYESDMWHIMAEYPEMLFISIVSYNVAYVMTTLSFNGLMFLDDMSTANYSPVVDQMHELRIVGYAKTCPMWLAPTIRPYYLYADIRNGVLYPDNIPLAFSEGIDWVENPNLSMYKALIDSDADCVFYSHGELKYCKKGGV